MQVAKKGTKSDHMTENGQNQFWFGNSSEDTSLNIRTLMTGTYQPSSHHSIRTIMCGAVSVYYMEWAAAI
jgi:L-ribulose-5-phosphate 3-epimerase UlaE